MLRRAGFSLGFVLVLLAGCTSSPAASPPVDAPAPPAPSGPPLVEIEDAKRLTLALPGDLGVYALEVDLASQMWVSASWNSTGPDRLPSSGTFGFWFDPTPLAGNTCARASPAGLWDVHLFALADELPTVTLDPGRHLLLVWDSAPEMSFRLAFVPQRPGSWGELNATPAPTPWQHRVDSFAAGPGDHHLEVEPAGPGLVLVPWRVTAQFPSVGSWNLSVQVDADSRCAQFERSDAFAPMDPFVGGEKDWLSLETSGRLNARFAFETEEPVRDVPPMHDARVEAALVALYRP